jgi:hypothetical protein
MLQKLKVFKEEWNQNTRNIAGLDPKEWERGGTSLKWKEIQNTDDSIVHAETGHVHTGIRIAYDNELHVQTGIRIAYDNELQNMSW